MEDKDKDDASSAWTEVENRHPVARIVKFLEKDILKLQMKGRIPWFMLFMVILHVDLWLVALDIFDAGHYYRNQGSRVGLGDSVFLKTATLDEFWGWMKEEAVKMWELDPLQNPDKPLGLLILRQVRVLQDVDKSNHERHLIPSHIDLLMRNTTFPPYESSHVSQEDFYPQPRDPGVEALLVPHLRPPWRSNRVISQTPMLQKMPQGSSIQGRLATYDDPEFAFTLYFEFNMSQADVKGQVEALERLRWIDDATRAVFVEHISFNVAQRSFLLTSFALEISTTGLLLPTVHLFPFVIHNFWQNRFIAVFIFDILIMIFTLTDLGDLFWTLTRRSPDEKSMIQLVDAWTVVQLVQGILFILCYVSRITMWAEGIRLQDDNYYNKISAEFTAPGGDEYLAKELLVFEKMSKYALLYESAYTRIAVGTLVAWIRVLGFFRFWKNYGILAETMSNSSSLLGGWCITFFLIFIPYGIAGHILFGNTLKDFRSLTNTTAYLLFMIARGSIDNYSTMDVMYPVWSPIFFISFLTLAWLVMLNLFIAIVTGTFEHVQSAAPPNGGYAKWHPRAFLTSLNAYLNRRIHELEMLYRKSNKKLNRKAAKKMDERMEKREKEEKAKVTKKNQYMAIDFLKELGCDGERECHLEGLALSKTECFDKVQGVIPQEELDRVFQLCEYEAAASSRYKTVTERWTTQTEKRTEYVYRDLLPTVRQLEEDLSKTGMLEDTFDVATQKITDVGPMMRSLRQQEETMVDKMNECNTCLPHISQAQEVAKKIESKHQDTERTGRQAEKTLRSTRDVSEMLSSVQAAMVKSSDFLTKKTRKTLWGMSEREYDEVAPIVLESRTGKGKVQKVEKMGKPPRLHAGDVALPDDGYTNWLSSKVGDDAVVRRRLAAVKSEIDENIL